MNKWQFRILMLSVTFHTLAVVCLIIYQEQARLRGAANTEKLCAFMERETGEPCDLQAPPKGVVIRQGGRS